MNATAQFIKDRALSLSYEARRYPKTAKMAAAWLTAARAWADRNGLPDLSVELAATCLRIESTPILPDIAYPYTGQTIMEIAHASFSS